MIVNTNVSVMDMENATARVELVHEHVKPFIRWAGGKQNLVKQLAANLPKNEFNVYFEPFLGAGSLFLFSQFRSSHLSDINPHLINSYEWIRECPSEVYSRLIFHRRRLSEDYYYRQRGQFNKKNKHFTIEQAARFIFLVHTSFNGIYRVNQKGEYNVPFGKPNPAIPDLMHLNIISQKLKSAEISNCLYEDILPKVGKGDLVYFDPPYPPLNETSFFQHYSIDKFPHLQQVILSENAKNLSAIGAFIMVSNADTPAIRKLYKGWNLKRVDAVRFVNCKSERKKVNELIITNY